MILPVFLNKLAFPILTFHREGEEWAPMFVQLNKHLSPEALKVLGDGTLQPTAMDETPAAYYGPGEGEVLFLTAFPFQSVVSDDSQGPSMTPIKRLLNLLKGERRDIGYLYVYAVAVGAIGLALPLGTQAIVGFISGGMWLNTVVLLIALVMIALVVSGILQIMQISMVEIIQRRIFAKTAFEFAYRIPRMDAEALFKHHAPELINRFFDIVTLQKGLPTLLISLLTAVIQIIFSLVLLSFYHPFFVFFGLFLVGLLVLIFYLTGPKGQQSAIAESKHKYKVAQWLEELARVLNSFKLVGSTQMPVQRVNREIDNYLIHRKVHFSVLIRQFSYVIAFKTFIIGGLLVLGTILVVDRQITLGQFVASELIIVLVIGSVETIILNMDTVYDMLAAVDKIGQVTDLKLEDEGNATVPREKADDGILIQAQNLGYQYPQSSKYALKNVDLVIDPGDRVCITGYNGSGKSTLLNILAGIYSSYEGSVTVGGVSLQNLDRSVLRDHIAANISQEDIFDGSVLDNITLGKPTTDYKTAIDALKAVGALEAVNQLPHGLDTHLVSEGKNLSTGLANKIILARCIAKQPKVIILNDFFQFFSKTDQQALIRYLTDERHTWSLVVVSTDPVILSQCTKVVVLREGEKVVEGTYDEVKDHTFFKQLVFDEYSAGLSS